MLYCVLVVFGFVFLVNGFPDGAPPDTCVKERFNQPNHGKARSLPLETLPFQVVASSSHYRPSETISVTISGHDVFRGFFMQARDAKTNEWIGEFIESSNTHSIPECSAITHADNKDKSQATLIWKAPQLHSGQVFFTGTVLKDYSTFWANIVAQTPI